MTTEPVCAWEIVKHCCPCDEDDHVEIDDFIDEYGEERYGLDVCLCLDRAPHHYRGMICDRPEHPPMSPGFPHEKWMGHPFTPVEVVAL